MEDTTDLFEYFGGRSPPPSSASRSSIRIFQLLPFPLYIILRFSYCVHRNFVYSAVRNYYNYADDYWRFAPRDMFLAAHNLGMRTPGSAVEVHPSA